MYRLNILQEAERVVERGFSGLKLSVGRRNSKTTYHIDNLEYELVLRLVGRAVQSTTGVRQENRVQIVKTLMSLLSEGVDYRVYRLDIRSFFESVDVGDVLARLRADRSFSRQCLRLLENLFSHLKILGVNGLPRGLAISSILAEFALRDFDRAVGSTPHIFYYARFVDDIIVISRGDETPKKQLKAWARLLPPGLHFNNSKTRWIDFGDHRPHSAAVKEFDFLGYQLIISSHPTGRPSARAIYADISVRKQNKIKSEIVKSALQFCSDGNFTDLIDRLKLLSSNATVYDQARQVKRKVGVYYNYQLIDADKAQGLAELDRFIKSFFLSGTGPISLRLKAKLSPTQRRRLLTISFERGFKSRHFVHFSGARLADLMRCWKHV